MTAPRVTPPGTVEQPERSSRRIARTKPLGWLPWALLGALAALLALVLLLVNAVDDDGAQGPADDRLGQVNDDDDGDGDSAVGADGEADGGGGSLAALSSTALVGGGGLPPVTAARTPGAEPLAAAPGTAGAVLFAVGSAEVDAEGLRVVSAAATALAQAGAKSVTVVGHTDVVAGDPTNDPLSQQRADAVAQALAAQLPGVRITTAARGQEEPVADNATDAGRQLNRRAVITADA